MHISLNAHYALDHKHRDVHLQIAVPKSQKAVNITILFFSLLTTFSLENTRRQTIIRRHIKLRGLHSFLR